MFDLGFSYFHAIGMRKRGVVWSPSPFRMLGYINNQEQLKSTDGTAILQYIRGAKFGSTSGIQIANYLFLWFHERGR